jgi:hypothetical protein
MTNPLAEVDPRPPVFCQRRRPIAPQNPRADGAQGGFKRQAAPLEYPEDKHNDKGENERPQARVNQEQKNRRKGARIKHKEARGFLRISPMNVHNGILNAKF